MARVIHSGWNHGLDLARAMAVSMVVYSHGSELIPSFGFLPWLASKTGVGLRFLHGWWGVQIFFSLSGYLIGRRIIHSLCQGERRSAIRFALLRWLRTIPTYWILLVALSLLYGIPLFSERFLLNASFMHTARPSTIGEGILSVSWSLVIEEWTYALFAILLFASAALRLRPTPEQSARFLLASSFLLWVFSMGMRITALQVPGMNWELYKKTATWHMDALCGGFLLAAFEVLRRNRFLRLTKASHLCLFSSLAAMAIFSIYFRRAMFETPDIWEAYSMAILHDTVSSLLPTLLLCGCLSLDTLTWPAWLRHLIAFLADKSYSIYLVHLPLLAVAQWYAPHREGLVPFGMFLLLSLGLGWFCWLLFERPFMALRSRIRSQMSIPA